MKGESHSTQMEKRPCLRDCPHAVASLGRLISVGVSETMNGVSLVIWRLYDLNLVSSMSSPSSSTSRHCVNMHLQNSFNFRILAQLQGTNMVVDRGRRGVMEANSCCFLWVQVVYLTPFLCCEEWMNFTSSPHPRIANTTWQFSHDLSYSKL